MSRVRFIPAARIEFLAEVVYYHEAEPMLAERFTAAVKSAAARALAFPLEHASRDGQGISVFNSLSSGSHGYRRFRSGTPRTSTVLPAIA